MTFLDLESRPIRVTAFGVTDVGRKRSANQDNFLIADLSRTADGGGYRLEGDEDDSGGRPGEFTLGPKGALLVVADGMGGAAGGAVASKLATSYIYQLLTAAWLPERNMSPSTFAGCLEESVQEANAKIYQSAQKAPDLQGMGSTATVVGLLDTFFYAAQVGDSRAYVVRDGVARQLTRDQSVVQSMVDAGELTEEEAESSRGRNVILQAMGTSPHVEVDVTYQELRRGDTILICSDGLSGEVSRDELGRAAAEITDLPRLCSHLIERANESGGPDNITVVAARVDGEGVSAPTARDTVERQVFHL